MEGGGREGERESTWWDKGEKRGKGKKREKARRGKGGVKIIGRKKIKEEIY